MGKSRLEARKQTSHSPNKNIKQLLQVNNIWENREGNSDSNNRERESEGKYSDQNYRERIKSK